QYVEPLITKSKTDSTHSRRIVFSYLQDKESVKVLFDEISEKVNDRPGGYTRIIKTGSRLGDNADMCIMELVDYNELLLAEKEPKKAKTRRSRRGKKSTQTEALPEVTAEPVSETEDVEETDMVSEPAEEQVDDVKAEIVEETVEEVKETETITAEASEEESKESSEPDADSEEDSKKE
ncbi:MAG: 50S ribosomal protein L17, partial [Cyclobacteriaceae bacterium]|nr:50S ribosomal protein L17 [Cyclobacteriaceae bacterium]